MQQCQALSALVEHGSPCTNNYHNYPECSASPLSALRFWLPRLGLHKLLVQFPGLESERWKEVSNEKIRSNSFPTSLLLGFPSHLCLSYTEVLPVPGHVPHWFKPWPWPTTDFTSWLHPHPALLPGQLMDQGSRLAWRILLSTVDYRWDSCHACLVFTLSSQQVFPYGAAHSCCSLTTAF